MPDERRKQNRETQDTDKHRLFEDRWYKRNRELKANLLAQWHVPYPYPGSLYEFIQQEGEQWNTLI